MRAIILFVLLTVAYGYIYRSPIVLKTEISYSCNFDFDQFMGIIYSSNDKEISAWNLNGELIKRVYAPTGVNVSAIAVNEYTNEIMVSYSDASIYSYDTASIIYAYDIVAYSKVSILVTNSSFNYVVVNQKTGYFYVVANVGYAIILSYDNQNNLLANVSLPFKTVEIENAVIDEFNGDLYMATTPYNMLNFTVIIMDINGNIKHEFPVQSVPATSLIIFDNAFLIVENLFFFDVYSLGSRIYLPNLSYENLEERYSLQYWKKYDVFYYIDLYNETLHQMIPTITVTNLDRTYVEKINYGTNDIMFYHNINVRIHEASGTVIASINDEIKIWKPYYYFY